VDTVSTSSNSTSSGTATRSLHLVDIENLAGDPCASPAVVLDTFDHYLELARWQPKDHVIVAANPHLLAKVVFDLPVPCNAHSACGRDGADRELLARAAPEFVASRYGRLVVGSGDHIFASRAHAVRELGADVLVVARADGCSSRLYRFDHQFLPESLPDVLAA
jgi:hypothetical protein